MITYLLVKLINTPRAWLIGAIVLLAALAAATPSSASAQTKPSRPFVAPTTPAQHLSVGEIKPLSSAPGRLLVQPTTPAQHLSAGDIQPCSCNKLGIDRLQSVLPLHEVISPSSHDIAGKIVALSSPSLIYPPVKRFNSMSDITKPQFNTTNPSVWKPTPSEFSNHQATNYNSRMESDSRQVYEAQKRIYSLLQATWFLRGR
jgi:hypothetical protein